MLALAACRREAFHLCSIIGQDQGVTLYLGRKNKKNRRLQFHSDKLLAQNARMVVTDSGGIQKDAYFFSVPCITSRPEKEWVETVGAGWHVLVCADGGRIDRAIREFARPDHHLGIYGAGEAGKKIAHILIKTCPIRSQHQRKFNEIFR